MAQKKYYELIYEDEDLVVVNKALKVLSIPDRYRPNLPNIYDLLKVKYGEIYVVHRLDKDTSGVICFARTAESHKLLNQQFQARETTKQYLALVKGLPFPEKGIVDAAIAAHPYKQGLMSIYAKGKPSITNYEVIEAFKQYSLVACSILTGRTHQIRVHLQYIGHPLAVDESYGGAKALYLSEIKRRKFNLSKGTDERPMLERVPLHAHVLILTHPKTHKKIEFKAEMPKDMRAIINQLRKWDR